MAARFVCGIFVGGQSRRMGGYPKGLLPAPAPASPASLPGAGSQPVAPGLPLVVRLSTLAQGLGLPVWLVGQHPAYAGLGLPLLADCPPGHGPLGGLAALLGVAGEQGAEGAIALSCDLPFLGPRLLARLLAEPRSDAAPDPASSLPPATCLAVAPRWQPADRDTPVWEPLCARYDLAFLPLLRRALAEGGRSLQTLLSQAGARPLALDPDEQREVRDWDSPADVGADLPSAPTTDRTAQRTRP
jgi:molybdopterin-guanine dinucleotide biosynthesis protein A